MIIIFNPPKLLRQSFFQDLIAYLDEHQDKDVTLRQIKHAFANVKQLERWLEAYIQAGYIERKEKRYRLTLPLLTDVERVTLEQLIFVDNQTPIFDDLLAKNFQTQLTYAKNQVVIAETTTISRDSLTLANYFYKLKEQLPLSVEQENLYQLLGDVNPEYALKYLTTFLVKFLRKDAVSQKRPDIFVKALELLGYIEKNSQGKYVLRMLLDQENLTFTATKRDDALS